MYQYHPSSHTPIRPQMSNIGGNPFLDARLVRLFSNVANALKTRSNCLYICRRHITSRTSCGPKCRSDFHLRPSLDLGHATGLGRRHLFVRVSGASLFWPLLPGKPAALAECARPRTLDADVVQIIPCSRFCSCNGGRRRWMNASSLMSNLCSKSI